MYSEEGVSRLEPNQHIRLSPGMYFGRLDGIGLHNWLYTVVDEAVELAINNHCSSLNIALRPNNEIVVDYNGPGIPTHIIKHEHTPDVSALELMMTSNVYWNEDYSDLRRGGLMGFRLNGLNALASDLTVETRWNGSIWRQHYCEGKPISQIEDVRLLEAGEENGVTLKFTPDFSIFEAKAIEFDKISQRLRETAWLTPELKISLKDDCVQPVEEHIFQFEGGLSDYVQHLNLSKSTLTPVISGQREIEPPSGHYKRMPFKVKFALQYSTNRETTVIGYVNNWKTTHNSVHVAAFRAALFTALNQYPLGYSLDTTIERRDIQFDAIFNGLTAVIHILHPDPQFISQSEMRFISAQAYGPISGAIFETIMKYLSENPELAQTITTKCRGHLI